MKKKIDMKSVIVDSDEYNAYREKWISNPLLNPFTNQEISITGKMYKSLLKFFKIPVIKEKKKKPKIDIKILSPVEIDKTLPKKRDKKLIITEIMQKMWGEKCVPLTKSILHQIIDSGYSTNNFIYFETFTPQYFIHHLEQQITIDKYSDHISKIKKHVAVNGKVFIEYTEGVTQYIYEEEKFFDKDFDCFKLSGNQMYVFIFIDK